MLQLIIILWAYPWKFSGGALPNRLIELLLWVETPIAMTCIRYDLLVPKPDMLHITVEPIYHQLHTNLLPLLIHQAHQFIFHAKLCFVFSHVKGRVEVEFMYLLNAHIEVQLSQYVMKLV